jgi:hypothetical protein
MKTYFSLILLVFTSFGFSQFQPISINSKFNTTPSKLFDNYINKKSRLGMLGKISQTDVLDINTISLFPKNYSWSSDIRRIQDFKAMALNIRQQDLCGRDLLFDIHSEVIQNVNLKSMTLP